MKNNNFKVGDRIFVNGNSDELGINDDYRCNVSTEGTVDEDSKPYQKKILVILDVIDGDRNACVLIKRNKLERIYN